MSDFHVVSEWQMFANNFSNILFKQWHTVEKILSNVHPQLPTLSNIKRQQSRFITVAFWLDLRETTSFLVVAASGWMLRNFLFRGLINRKISKTSQMITKVEWWCCVIWLSFSGIDSKMEKQDWKMIFGYYLVISTQAHVRSSIINLKPLYKVIFNKNGLKPPWINSIFLRLSIFNLYKN